ncbi:hypothetical protein E2562_008884 [Oryza meyeriana var. granulata]|uniref:Uncharacterized protein n=1 Tax=Oryza meyeriana var. granulata TaxID=110450 RepID=A0A6G1D0D2_9ORYZ|nr:hypothetical protein E2562_008884 [Oryza meyeriana var. granulata]
MAKDSPVLDRSTSPGHKLSSKKIIGGWSLHQQDYQLAASFMRKEEASSSSKQPDDGRLIDCSEPFMRKKAEERQIVETYPQDVSAEKLIPSGDRLLRSSRQNARPRCLFSRPFLHSRAVFLPALALQMGRTEQLTAWASRFWAKRAMERLPSDAEGTAAPRRARPSDVEEITLEDLLPDLTRFGIGTTAHRISIN